MTDGPETPRLRELVYDLNRQVYTLEQARALLTHCREYLSLARAETPRLRALAEQAAKTAHWSIAGPAFGHLEVLPGNPQFDICPHPYCVLVRAGAKEPALKPKEWECICTHHYRAHDRNTGRCNEGGCECSGYVDGPASASLVGVVAGDAPATDAELEGARPDREATCAWDCQLDEGHAGNCSSHNYPTEFERLEAQKDAMLAGRRPWESHVAGAAPAQEPTRYSTREIVTDAVGRHFAETARNQGKHRLGHNPSWVKAADYDALAATAAGAAAREDKTLDGYVFAVKTMAERERAIGYSYRETAPKTADEYEWRAAALFAAADALAAHGAGRPY